MGERATSDALSTTPPGESSIVTDGCCAPEASAASCTGLSGGAEGETGTLADSPGTTPAEENSIVADGWCAAELSSAGVGGERSRCRPPPHAVRRRWFSEDRVLSSCFVRFPRGV
jgi:hypothetical protein